MINKSGRILTCLMCIRLIECVVAFCFAHLGKRGSGLAERVSFDNDDAARAAGELVEQIGLEALDLAQQLIFVEQMMQYFVRLASRRPVADQRQPQYVLDEGHARERAEQLRGTIFGAYLVQTLKVFGSQLGVQLFFHILLGRLTNIEIIQVESIERHKKNLQSFSFNIRIF